MRGDAALVHPDAGMAFATQSPKGLAWHPSGSSTRPSGCLRRVKQLKVPGRGLAPQRPVALQRAVRIFGYAANSSVT